jgi:hypothetical protein
MASISASHYVPIAVWQADVYSPVDDDFPASVTLLARERGVIFLQLSGLTPDECDTIASELVAAATRARRQTANRASAHLARGDSHFVGDDQAQEHDATS